MSKYNTQRLVCLLRKEFKCSMKEAWNTFTKYENAKKQAQNVKSGITENSNQLKIDYETDL